jgi:hypothetical protein
MRSLALLGALVILGSGAVAQGDPAPVDAVLFPVSNLDASGSGPQTVSLSFIDKSLYEDGFQLQYSTNPLYEPDNINWIDACSKLDAHNPPGNATGTYVQASCNLSVAPASTQIYYMRARATITHYFKVGQTNLPPQADLLNGPWSQPDPFIVGPRGMTNVQIVNPGSTTPKITWTNDSTPDALKVQNWVYRSTSTFTLGSGQPIAKLPKTVAEYTDIPPSLPSGQFWHYRVIAVRETTFAFGADPAHFERATTVGVPSDVVNRAPTPCTSCPTSSPTATPSPSPSPGPVSLLAPSNLTAMLIGTGNVQLYWTDNATGENGFYIESSNDGVSFNRRIVRPVPCTDPVPCTTNTAYLDTIPPDTVRYYRVIAYRNDGTVSPPSNIAGPVGPVPAAPTDLIAHVVRYNRVDLTWVDHSTTEDSFRIEYCNGTCTNAGSWYQLGITGANVTNFSDTPPVPNAITGATTRSYRVFAVNGTTSSNPSNIATVTTPPGPPTGDLDAVANGKRRIDLTWTYSGPTPKNFILEYAPTPNGPWAELAQPGAGATSYIDTYALNPGQQRCYRLRSFFTATGASDPSNVACAVTDPPEVPLRPTNLVADAPDSVHIDLTWTDNANNEQGFKIDRSDDHGQTYRTIKTLTTPCSMAAPCTGMNASYTDGIAPVNGHLYGLQPNTEYCYRVRAYNEDGDSASFPNPNLPNEQKVCTTTPSLPKPEWQNPDPHMQNQIQPYTCEIHGIAQFNSGAHEVQVGIIDLTTGSTTTVMTLVHPTFQKWFVVAKSSYDPYAGTYENGGSAAVQPIAPGRYNLTARSHLNVNNKDFYSENTAIIGWIVPADSIPC